MKDLDNTLFGIDISTPAPREGSLLVAEPFLSDEYFNHAVITLIDYAPGANTMGIVMNRTSGYTLGQMVEGFDDGIDIPVFIGGPMSRNRMFYIHRLGELFSGSVEILPGLWIGGNYEQVLQYIRDGYPADDLIRFFIGYSGWDKGQLEEEIRQHVWAVPILWRLNRCLPTAMIPIGTKLSGKWAQNTVGGRCILCFRPPIDCRQVNIPD